MRWGGEQKERFVSEQKPSEEEASLENNQTSSVAVGVMDAGKGNLGRGKRTG